MDPHANTREEFTNHLLSYPIPSNATAEWRQNAETLQAVLRKLAFHDAMLPNIRQTYMTPAASKNRIYFMWDFVGRTLGYLYAIPPTESWNAENELWLDVTSRTFMGGSLILDTKPGALDVMVQASHPQQDGPMPQFDAETLDLARRLIPSA